MNSEALNTLQFLIAAGTIPGLVVWRNNCGVLKDERGGMVRFGVANGHGGSDFIGWYQGRFCAFEIKADKDNTAGHRLELQEHFLKMVIDAGGLAGFVRRPSDVARILAGRGCVQLKDYPREWL